jgi:acetyltransferase
LGTQLLRLLLQVGHDEQLDRISTEILSNNRAMQRVSQKLGFRIHRTAEASVMRVEIELSTMASVAYRL